jgi:hypothetical protein
MVQIYSQHVDTGSGFHVIELRDTAGNRHIVQIAVGADKCPMCGAVYPKDDLAAIDPKVMVAAVSDGLQQAEANVRAYAKKHGLKVK